MFRWHRGSCRKPDITVADDVLFCSSCDSAAELTSLHLHDDATSISHTSESPQSLDLRWPLSVQYSTKEDCNTDITESPTSNTNIRALHDACKPTQPSFKGEMPRADSQLEGRFYSPLAQKYDIRLLKLSALSSGGYMHGELDLVDLVYSPTFEALSYTWAGETSDNAKTKFVFIGPFWDVIPITTNCNLALRLLLSKGHLNIWVDSICINQQNPQERSHQVSIMREIFSKASQVLIYLGPAAKYSDEAVEALSTMNNLPPTKVHDPDSELSIIQKRGLELLFERRYFSRIWIIQEIAVAKAITLYCGEKGVSWSSFSTRGIRVPYRYHREAPWLSKYGRGNSSAMTKLEELLQLLDATSSCSASDPRDNVFAVLGLLHDGVFDGLVPDYLLSTKQVYTGIASYLIIRQNKTEILSYPKGRFGSLPSWVPDWSVYRAPKILPDEDDNVINSVHHTNIIFGIQNNVKGDGDQSDVKHQEDDNHCRLRYFDDSPLNKDNDAKNTDIIWLNAGHTAWTLFTTNERQSPRIRHLSRRLEGDGAEHPLNGRPSVNAGTGALNIQCTVVASFDSFRRISPFSFTRTAFFPGTQNEFQWLVETKTPVITEVDIVAYVPGCDSYLHLRKDRDSGCYTLLNDCSIGFRQGVVQDAQWTLDKYKFETISHVPGGRVANVNLFGGASEPSLLCASYGFDKSFLEYLGALRRSRLGEFVISYLKDRGTLLNNPQDNTLETYLDGPLVVLAIWKSATGWKASIRGPGTIDGVKKICNVVAEQTNFWSQPATWKVLDDVEAYINSIDSLNQMWSDWNQLAKSLAAIGESSLAGKEEGPSNTTSPITYTHEIDPQAASRLGITAYQASLPSLITALAKSTATLIHELESKSDLFHYPLPGAACEDENDGVLSSAERLQLGRIYTKFMRNKERSIECGPRDPLLNMGTEVFYSMVKSRINTLRWLSPSWQSFQGRLVEFRHVCQHMSAIDTLQEGISKTRRITIV